jgi:membrane-associated phospholipid phosphatase
MKAILYDWGGANVWIFHLVNNIRFDWLDNVMLLGTFLGDHNQFPMYLAGLTFIALLALGRPSQDIIAYRETARRWISVIAVFSIAYLLDGMLLAALKPFLDYPRPLLALPMGAVQVVGIPEYHHSLPSGHSSFAMLVIASLWPVLKGGWRVAGAFFVLWVGISRVSLGAHFPADVMAGFLSSLAVVLLVYACTQSLMKLLGRQKADVSG